MDFNNYTFRNLHKTCRQLHTCMQSDFGTGNVHMKSSALPEMHPDSNNCQGVRDAK